MNELAHMTLNIVLTHIQIQIQIHGEMLYKNTTTTTNARNNDTEEKKDRVSGREKYQKGIDANHTLTKK